MATKGPQKSHDELLEDYREYKPNGDAVHRYWMDSDDKWWDLSYYVHITYLSLFIAIDAATTTIMTPTQFTLNHTVTFVWVLAAGIYTYAMALENFFDPKMKEHR